MKQRLPEIITRQILGYIFEPREIYVEQPFLSEGSTQVKRRLIRGTNNRNTIESMLGASVVNQASQNSMHAHGVFSNFNPIHRHWIPSYEAPKRKVPSDLRLS
jgi:hypothetical protein